MFLSPCLVSSPSVAMCRCTAQRTPWAKEVIAEGKILTLIKTWQKGKNRNHLHLLRPDLCTEAPGEDQEDRDEGEHQQDDGHLQSEKIWSVKLYRTIIISSVRSSNSHPDLLLTHQQHPLFQITPVLNTGLSLSEPLQLYKGYNAI